jgi:DNA-binding response OmpR family regulator
VIFLVEDDQKIRTELTKLLKKYGYECDSSDDFANIVEIILKRKPQLVLLDLNLPVCDGFCICRELRRRSHIPIIVVTSRDSETDELVSMDLGADDFITKPYNTQILLAHITAVLKRTNPQKVPGTVNYRGLEVDFAKSSANGPEGSTELTKNELKILGLFFSARGRIVTRDEIMNTLWQSDEFVDDNTLTVNINRLRRKLESIGVRDYLVTKRGQGYRI